MELNADSVERSYCSGFSLGLDARHLRDPVSEGGDITEYGGRQRQRAAPRERYDAECCTTEHRRPARVALRKNITCITWQSLLQFNPS